LNIIERQRVTNTNTPRRSSIDSVDSLYLTGFADRDRLMTSRTF
jgi:hypothetical protein